MKLLEALSEKEKSLGRTRRFPKDTIIYHEGEKCESVCMVITGSIKISSYSLSGMEIVYNRINTGGMFGNNLLFSDSPYYKGHVISIEETTIIEFSKQNLLNILQSNAIFLELYLSLHANFSKQLNGKIKLLSIDSAEERLLYYLKENQPLKYKSITSLAESIHLTRETTSRLISKLAKEGKIIHKNKTLSLPNQ